MDIVQDDDLAQSFGLARRRHAELCRQNQMFNARNRILGGDKKTWDIQVCDQKIREATEKARHETFAAERRHDDKATCILESREQRGRRGLRRALADFQRGSQRPETRREFDLSDPLARKGELPARRLDNDVRNSVSGMQRFLGEDLHCRERRRLQQEQNREWALQQRRAREQARADQKRAEELYTETRLQFDQTAKDLQNQELAARKAVCAAVKEFNKMQALESAERKSLEKKQEQEDDMAQIVNLLRGDLLSEDPEQAASSFGPHRVVPDRWKGMSRDQLGRIRLEQQQQMQEKMRLQEEERQRDEDWDRQRVEKARADLLCERQQLRQQRLLRRALDGSNRSLAAEQRLQRQYMKEVCTNRASDDFFTQFNTRSR
ncbi:RIB43A-like with coiled-coils protein 2 [Pipistrellus kuhlii]|uniref:RIB43A domain with coiled-coils 2 n=1 Tax=Pipistrellus kuhlii TaxID=59472 RepID=A0A7J7RMZ7_PIPKU|nr:RIB43A-like with coiled-coils protein 2 [Pipistrellus kuhlii]KAF6277548.1 RIB43A domain with coiled-coils 2 [Pipistrellus kuhlii]